MNRLQTLEEFYKERFNKIPPSLRAEIGHFNVFKFEDLAGCSVQPIPYSRREYFKISLIKGENRVHYADRTIDIKKQGLLFANPQIPYKWEQISQEQSGYSCVFTANFFHHFGNPNEYSVFQPTGMPVIELTDEQAGEAKKLFDEMSTEWESEYIHKYDRMRIMVFELLNIGVKAQSVHSINRNYSNAAQKITTHFLELLERQFPVEDKGYPIRLRAASDFAMHLSVHINHLNKALKETMQKPTTVIIHERILMEAKILLKHSTKDIAEIGFDLGFKENTHFNNFFKKHTSITPTQFRMT